MTSISDGFLSSYRLARCVRARPIVQSVRAAVCAYARADLRAFSTPASLVKELRDKTGSPMMDCKRALEACNGDMKSDLFFFLCHLAQSMLHGDSCDGLAAKEGDCKRSEESRSPIG